MSAELLVVRIALIAVLACTLMNVILVAVCVKLYSEIVKTDQLKRINR
jgi:hypothetical protein